MKEFRGGGETFALEASSIRVQLITGCKIPDEKNPAVAAAGP
jgi:hypothetical protein